MVRKIVLCSEAFAMMRRIKVRKAIYWTRFCFMADSRHVIWRNDSLSRRELGPSAHNVDDDKSMASCGDDGFDSKFRNKSKVKFIIILKHELGRVNITEQFININCYVRVWIVVIIPLYGSSHREKQEKRFFSRLNFPRSLRDREKGRKSFRVVIAYDIHSCILNTLDVTKIVNEGERGGERLL